MEKNSKSLPKIRDLVSVKINGVNYYGYIGAIDSSYEKIRVGIEFNPYEPAWNWYNLDDVLIVKLKQED